MHVTNPSARSALIRLASVMPVGSEDRRAILRTATLLPVYREADYIDAAYRAAELYPGDPTKVFAIVGAALNVKPSGAFDPAELGDVLTTYNFHRERSTIEPLIQAGKPIPYRQIVGRSPFITTRGLSKNQPENEKWRYDNANQTLPVPQVLRAIADFIGLKPGQMILTGDLIRYLMEYVNVSVRNLSRLGIGRNGPVTMHRDMVR
jgi:hypothetical protein